MLVFVEGTAEPVPSSDIQVGDPLGIGDRVGWRVQGCGCSEGSMGSVLVVEVLELPERVQELALVPDERAVQELAVAGLAPSVP